VNNFLAQIQVRLSPNFVSHTLGQGDDVIKFWKVKVKGQGRWGGMRCTERRSSFIPVSLAFVMLALVSSVPSQQIDWEECLRDDLF